jgi:hypothetical protein
LDVEEHRTRGVARIADVLASAGEIPNEPGVHRAESEFAGFGCGLCAGHVLENPLELRAGEVGVDHKAGFATDRSGEPAGFEAIAHRSGATVLPDNGIADRTASFSLPDYGSLTLIGDANRGDVICREARLFERLSGHIGLRGPDLFGIVFDPAGLREDLAELLLGDGQDRSAVIENDRTRAGGSLVES